MSWSVFVERTFTVRRPVAEVFDFLADFEHTEHWDPGTVTTRRTSGDGGLGTTYDNESEFLGRRVRLVYETITFRRPEAVQVRGRNKASTATDSMTFTDAGGKTTCIHYRADFTFHGWVRLVAPLVVRRGRLDDLADETVDRIVRTLEDR
ncbi:SRPBCC family protein [Nocardioides litoris]|uniref:SRPBCC family protein n=1 Tax=Nocardioides litoris TaxID=1926648 RepID=UPI00111E813A|nr:SRPBCC family protein [Nocardioides litoris]